MSDIIEWLSPETALAASAGGGFLHWLRAVWRDRPQPPRTLVLCALLSSTFRILCLPVPPSAIDKTFQGLAQGQRCKSVRGITFDPAAGQGFVIRCCRVSIRAYIGTEARVSMRIRQQMACATERIAPREQIDAFLLL